MPGDQLTVPAASVRHSLFSIDMYIYTLVTFSPLSPRELSALFNTHTHPLSAQKSYILSRGGGTRASLYATLAIHQWMPDLSQICAAGEKVPGPMHEFNPKAGASPVL